MSTATGPDLTFARRQVEKLMDDTCTVVRPGTGQGAFDDETGTYGDPPATPIYGGRCKFKPNNEVQPHDDTRGEQHRHQRLYEVGLPWDAPDFQEGDLVTCTSARSDQRLLTIEGGIVREVIMKTMLVQRKLVIEVLT